MKLNALTHPKLLHFASLLDITRPTAIGHLELLWAFTAEMAPAGNLGKWPDGAIARACEWMGDPAAFVDALLQARLLDQHPEHRVIVHDWVDHCPRYVKARVQALGQRFVVPVVSSGGGAVVRPIGSAAVGNTKASHGKPRHGTHSDPTHAAGGKPELEFVGKVPSGASDGASNGAQQSDADLVAAWDLVRSTYPARAGRAHNWLIGERNWRQQIEDGRKPEVLLEGVQRYAAYVAGGGISSAAYVLGIDKFFGDPDHPWAQPWDVPAGRGSRSVSDRLAALGPAADEGVPS